MVSPRPTAVLVLFSTSAKLHVQRPVPTAPIPATAPRDTQMSRNLAQPTNQLISPFRTSVPYQIHQSIWIATRRWYGAEVRNGQQNISALYGKLSTFYPGLGHPYKLPSDCLSGGLWSVPPARRLCPTPWFFDTWVWLTATPSRLLGRSVYQPSIVALGSCGVGHSVFRVS